MRHAESRLQVGCVSWFRLAFPSLALSLFSVPNGGLRGAREAAIMKSEGIVAGVSDLILLEAVGGYHGLCIEMKQERTTVSRTGHVGVSRGRQSESQKIWQAHIESRGYKYVVCYSFDDFRREVCEYLRGDGNDENGI